MLNWIFLPVTFFALELCSYGTNADALIYKKTGDTVVLSLSPETEPITKITWKHNTDLAMEWLGGTSDIDSYRQFTDRGSLNTSTGAMTITGLTLNYSGTYTPEINNKARSLMKLRVIDPVPKPHYTKSCEGEDERICNYTCEARNAKDAEPITNVWISNDKRWTSTGTLSVTPDTKQDWFRCVLKNPVSEEKGEEISNPFSQQLSALRMPLGFIISFVLLVAVVIFLIWRFCRVKREPGTRGQIDLGYHSIPMETEERTLAASNHQDTSNHNPVSSVTRETDFQETSAGNQASAENHTSGQDQTSAENHASAENPASAEGQTSAEKLTSAEEKTSAEDQTSAENPASAEGQRSAENPASAEGQTSEGNQTSVEGQTSEQDQTSAENPASAEGQTSAENHTSEQDQTSAENHTSEQDQTSAENHTSEQEQTFAENPASAVNPASAEGQTSPEGQTSAPSPGPCEDTETSATPEPHDQAPSNQDKLADPYNGDQTPQQHLIPTVIVNNNMAAATSIVSNDEEASNQEQGEDQAAHQQDEDQT